jgi:hypothetical protein
MVCLLLLFVDTLAKAPFLLLVTIATTERGEPLRRLFLPKQLQSQFLSIASANTRNKIETCGILGGKLVICYYSLYKPLF